MATGYVMVCSDIWVQPPPPLYFGQPQFECYGTLKNVPYTEPSSLELSPEDHAEYRDLILYLFVVVFGVLVLKKVLFTR